MNICTKEKFCWFPHKCDVSGKQLFLKKYYTLTQRIDGPGSPVFIRKRVSSKHYLVLQLSNKVEGVFKNDL